MVIALQNEISRSPKSRYDHRLHGVLALPHPHINPIVTPEMMPQEDSIPHVLFVAKIMRVLPEILIYLSVSLQSLSLWFWLLPR